MAPWEASERLRVVTGTEDAGEEEEATGDSRIPIVVVGLNVWRIKLFGCPFTIAFVKYFKHVTTQFGAIKRNEK